MADKEFTTTEVWKDIPRLPGYQVSNQGLVRSFWKRIMNPRVGTKRVLTNKPRVLKPLLSARGYHTIRACDTDMIKRTCQVHRLVLEAFVSPCPVGHEGCHRNGSRTDNYLDNLYWATRARNCLDTRRQGRNGRAILDATQITEIVRLHHEGLKQADIADRLGINQPVVSYTLVRRGYRRNRVRFAPEEVERIVARWRDRISLREIAAEFGTTAKTIDHVLSRALGIPRTR